MISSIDTSPIAIWLYLLALMFLVLSFVLPMLDNRKTKKNIEQLKEDYNKWIKQAVAYFEAEDFPSCFIAHEKAESILKEITKIEKKG